MTGLVVLGARGHGIDVASIATAAGFAVLGFLDDDPTIDDRLGPCTAATGFESYLLGVNDPRIRQRLDLPELTSPSVMHPSVSAWHDVQTSPGVVVGANTTIGPQVSIGRHTHLNFNVGVTRARIGQFVTVAPGVTICGDVIIGDGVTIGAGATISNLCQIDVGAVIGAGAVVPPRTVVPPGETWAGVPARPLTSVPLVGKWEER